MIQVRDYRTAEGKIPYRIWWNKIRDAAARVRIEQRITRLEAGLFGDCESVGGGVYELRIHYGPGYRVYFGKHGRDVVLLLLGGDKRNQQRDIEQAKSYWRDFKKRAK